MHTKNYIDKLCIILRQLIGGTKERQLSALSLFNPFASDFTATVGDINDLIFNKIHSKMGILTVRSLIQLS